MGVVDLSIALLCTGDVIPCRADLRSQFAVGSDLLLQVAFFLSAALESGVIQQRLLEAAIYLQAILIALQWFEYIALRLFASLAPLNQSATQFVVAVEIGRHDDIALEAQLLQRE